MNSKQTVAIARLTNAMVHAAPFRSQTRMVFVIEPVYDGFMVNGYTDCTDLAWHESTFQALAFVGPRGGIRNYTEHR